MFSFLFACFSTFTSCLNKLVCLDCGRMELRCGDLKENATRVFHFSYPECEGGVEMRGKTSKCQELKERSQKGQLFPPGIEPGTLRV